MKKSRFIYIIFCLVSVMCRNMAYSQQRGVPSETISAAWQPVKVDHYIGIRGGYAMGNARFEPTRQTEYKMGLLFGGLVYKFDVPEQKYVGCIEGDINWSQRGYRVFQSYESDDVYERTWNSIEIPILWQPYLPLSKGGSRFYLSAGPYFSYAYSSDFCEFNQATGEVYSQGKYEYDPTRDNRWEYGITFGVGLLFALKRFSISAEFRYNIGLSDALKGVTKYDENPFRSPVDQLAISVGVNYKLRIHK